MRQFEDLSSENRSTGGLPKFPGPWRRPVVWNRSGWPTSCLECFWHYNKQLLSKMSVKTVCGLFSLFRLFFFFCLAGSVRACARVPNSSDCVRMPERWCNESDHPWCAAVSCCYWKICTVVIEVHPWAGVCVCMRQRDSSTTTAWEYREVFLHVQWQKKPKNPNIWNLFQSKKKALPLSIWSGDGWEYTFLILTEIHKVM